MKGTLLESQDPLFQSEYSQLEDGRVRLCSRSLFDFESKCCARREEGLVYRSWKKEWFIEVGRRNGLSKLEEGLGVEVGEMESLRGKYIL
jgi:hypothetical protein